VAYSSDKRIASFTPTKPVVPEFEVTYKRNKREARLERRRNPEEEADLIRKKTDGEVWMFDWKSLEARHLQQDREFENLPLVYSSTNQDAAPKRERERRV